MDRREAVLRELNLYPLWVLREPPPAAAAPDVAAAVQQPLPTAIAAASAAAPSIEPPAALQVREPASGLEGLGWPQLKQMVRDCAACKLRAGCTQTVFGVGDEKAGWLFVGEGPGADEDAQGEPFVGQAGKLLDNMLLAIGLKRGKDVYIANIVKCRPPGNRNPEPDEIAACLPYLERQIQLIQPKIIVALGKVASNALLGRDATLASLRGKLHGYSLAAAQGAEAVVAGSRASPVPHQTATSHRAGGTIPLLVTYHPAYLLRTPAEKAKAWQDLRMAVKAMEDKPA